MKTEARIFFGVTAFFVVIAITYWFASYEDAGTVMLMGCAGLGLVAGSFLAFHARRMQPRPEDRTDAVVSDGVGAVGRFPNATIWPLGLALGATLIGVGLVFGLAVVLIGVAIFAISIVGMLSDSRRAARR